MGAFTVPAAKKPRRYVGEVGVDRYVTVDTHPADVVAVMNKMTGLGYAYKAVWMNLEDLSSGWQRILFEQEPTPKSPPDRSWLE